nr:unnamed protein product [Callosobruchus chinensis]
MEVDAIHSSLEHYFKPPLYVPIDYVNRMRQAKYLVNYVHYWFFKNFESLPTNLSLPTNFKFIRPGKKTGDPTVGDIRALRYDKGQVDFKIRHTNEWSRLPQRRPSNEQRTCELMPLYDRLVGIEREKYEALQVLKKSIDINYQTFYNYLPTKKRKRQPEKWLKNVKKTVKAHGQEDVGARGITKRKAELKPPCKPSCKIKCEISENKRLGVFENYWRLGNYERQRDFINSNTDKVGTKPKTISSRCRRQFSCVFYLPLDGVRIRVCKTMFLNTLGIKKGVVAIALKKRSSVNTSFSDRRGRHVKKVIPEVKNGIKRHTESFPLVASHYCGSDSERKYLSPDLNIIIMYRLYVEWCQNSNLPVAKESLYRYTFPNNYNLDVNTDEYKQHIKKKDSARNEKRKDKEQAGDSKERIVSINFDLQQVLVTPSDPTNNQLFYKTRLSTYNFTIYNVVSKEVGMYMYAMSTLKLESIDLKFLICGHSEMECDSMHSAITTEFKKGYKAYTAVDNLQFNDWKSFVSTNLNIRKKDTVGQPILWQKIFWIRVEASLPNYFKFKEIFDDEEFRVVDCNTNTRPSSHQPLLTLYKRPRCIAKTKYDRVYQEKSFHLYTKKDLRATCVAYDTRNIGQEEFDLHQEMKKETREEKNRDKESASVDAVFTMELEAVLLSPKSTVSTVYYKMKLAVHNFTLFNLKTRLFPLA